MFITFYKFYATVAKQLEILKVDVIEAGFAIASAGDLASITAISKEIKDSSICSLARASKGDIDAAYGAIKQSVQPRIHTFIATSPVHMEYKLKMTPDQVVERAVAMVSYAKQYVSDIEFSAEDACRSDIDFLIRIFEAVIKAGATTINVPDTVGYITPDEMYRIIHTIKTRVSNIDNVVISTHCHNDLGMAVANSLAAVSAGAGQIECTVNGIGERAGNTSLRPGRQPGPADHACGYPSAVRPGRRRAAQPGAGPHQLARAAQRRCRGARLAGYP